MYVSSSFSQEDKNQGRQQPLASRILSVLYDSTEKLGTAAKNQTSERDHEDDSVIKSSELKGQQLVSKYLESSGMTLWSGT